MKPPLPATGAGSPAPAQTGLRRVQKYSDQIYEDVMARIVDGRLPEGQKLPPESELAALFGVSRPVIRQALARLRADGVIVSRHGSGSYVQRRPAVDFLRLAPLGGMADVLRAYEYRVALEGEVAWLAAERRTETDLRQMATAVREMKQALQARELGAEADLRFHRAIATATRNPLFEFSMAALSDYIAEGVALTRRLSLKVGRARLERVQAEHEAIYQAIRARDSQAARTAMRAHIDNARQRMLTEESPGGEPPGEQTRDGQVPGGETPGKGRPGG
ncbi:FadR/GntR family transcriptional regulator [Orrella sp. JC864]|uniref:FadR/GntR family transcriptional regulator n=1 Tax=Orrella sp. JC864 TaxID=3120298 RepID=UPI0012BC28B1